VPIAVKYTNHFGDIKTFTFYVDADAPGGGDGSLGSPWNTLASVTSATLTPGQSVGLKRGSTFFSGLTISSAEDGTAGARITIGAYGSGARPIIDVSGAQDHGVAVNGDFVTVQDLDLRNAGGTNDSGEWSGVTFIGAADGLIRRCRMSGSQIGARIVNGAHRCRITECDFVDNNKMTVNDATADNDYGAHAIYINTASDCEVDHNTSSGHVATSIDYGYDGSFVEVIKGDRTHIHHNTSTDDLTMAELSPYETSCNDTWIHHNLCTRTAAVGGGRGTGFVCRGNRTVVEHNTVDIAGSHADGAGVTAIVATPVVDFLARVRNNILIHGNNAIFTTAGADVQESYNLRQGNYNGVTQAGTSINAAPQFVSASDRHLSSTSPARDAGLGGLGYTTDRDGLPMSGTPDMGCFEYQ
jgi:hypothetical protein